MQTQSFQTLFNRDLGRLISQIQAYQNEEDLWIKEGGINNSAGNLCLHLIGNLHEYIIRQLGHFEFVRDRDAEFNTPFVPKAELLSRLEETRRKLDLTFSSLTDEDLDKSYPEEMFGYPTTTHYFLVHLFGHFSYHLGQIDYHRRLLAGGVVVKYE